MCGTLTHAEELRSASKPSSGLTEGYCSCELATLLPVSYWTTVSRFGHVWHVVAESLVEIPKLSLSLSFYTACPKRGAEKLEPSSVVFGLKARYLRVASPSEGQHGDEKPFTLIHTCGQFRVASRSFLHIFGCWEKPRIPGGNPNRHGEWVQTPYRKAPWTDSLTDRKETGITLVRSVAHQIRSPGQFHFLLIIVQHLAMFLLGFIFFGCCFGSSEIRLAAVFLFNTNMLSFVFLKKIVTNTGMNRKWIIPFAFKKACGKG